MYSRLFSELLSSYVGVLSLITIVLVFALLGVFLSLFLRNDAPNK